MAFKQLQITQLAAPGVSEALVVQSGSILTYAITVGAIGTSVVIRLEGALDATNYGSLRQDVPSTPTVTGGDITISANGTYLYAVQGVALYARLRLVTITGGAPTVDCIIMAGEA